MSDEKPVEEVQEVSGTFPRTHGWHSLFLVFFVWVTNRTSVEVLDVCVHAEAAHFLIMLPTMLMD